MTHIRVETELDASPAEVWADIGNIATHVEWMHDADSIIFTTSAHEGVGAAFDCETRIGPIRLTDRMEITEWVEGATMGVRHIGLVNGEGRFTLESIGADRSRFVWSETLRFPWWLGGPVGGLVGGPILRWIWGRNLRLLTARFA